MRNTTWTGNTETGESFRIAYRQLEARMKALAQADGDIYLPNPKPIEPVDFVFLCMEPSLGRWARSAEEAELKVKSGFRNFISEIEDIILHFCIRTYLCRSAQRYHITDFSKGAMLVKRAGTARTQRYDRWYKLLLEEVNLVATPKARIFAVGTEVSKHLERLSFPRPFAKVIHYSRFAAKARAASIVGHEDKFAEFKSSVSLEDLLATAEDVLMASAVTARTRNETLIHLKNSQLSESRKQLIFHYKSVFETISRQSR